MSGGQDLDRIYLIYWKTNQKIVIQFELFHVSVKIGELYHCGAENLYPDMNSLSTGIICIDQWFHLKRIALPNMI